VHVLTLRVPDQPETLVPVRPGETLDAALTRCGYVRRPRGCRRGGCGQCAVHVVAGSVVDERPVADTVLGPERRAAGEALLCRSLPVTDVTVRVAPGQVRCVSPIQLSLAQRELPTHPTSHAGA
jgi:ferredoxin